MKKILLTLACFTILFIIFISYWPKPSHLSSLIGNLPDGTDELMIQVKTPLILKAKDVDVECIFEDGSSTRLTMLKIHGFKWWLWNKTYTITGTLDKNKSKGTIQAVQLIHNDQLVARARANLSFIPPIAIDPSLTLTMIPPRIDTPLQIIIKNNSHTLKTIQSIQTHRTEDDGSTWRLLEKNIPVEQTVKIDALLPFKVEPQTEITLTETDISLPEPNTIEYYYAHAVTDQGKVAETGYIVKPYE